MRSGLFKNIINKICLQIIYLFYMNKQDLSFNNLLWLICYKTQQSQTINVEMGTIKIMISVLSKLI